MAVFEACARYMQLQLDDSNCVGVLCFAHVHQCQQLRSKALEHIEKNFTQVLPAYVPPPFSITAAMKASVKALWTLLSFAGEVIWFNCIIMCSLYNH